MIVQANVPKGIFWTRSHNHTTSSVSCYPIGSEYTTSDLMVPIYYIFKSLSMYVQYINERELVV